MRVKGSVSHHVWCHTSWQTLQNQPADFRAPLKVGEAVVGRENAGWTTSKREHPCPCQNCSQWPPGERTGRGSLLNCHVPTMTRSVKGLKWTEMNGKGLLASVSHEDAVFYTKMAAAAVNIKYQSVCCAIKKNKKKAPVCIFNLGMVSPFRNAAIFMLKVILEFLPLF